MDINLFIDKEPYIKEIFKNTTGLNKELGVYFREKYKKLPNISNDFDLIYNDIINYCKDIDKIIVIRTCISNCYERIINRYKINNSNYIEEELNNYKERKKKIFEWYKFSNKFIENVHLLDNNLE